MTTMTAKPKSKDFRRKIVTPQELSKLIGAPPRKNTVVMCHGCFDIVHPGHLRHLMYAKERAAILVASLTSDAHITKGQMRPFVPEQLRAVNLAALEMVDYVIIDPNSTPIENLKIIRPDLYAKGFEYFSGGVPPKTQEEIDILDSYGGEILFTPGDVVYSSSFLIDAAPPKIGAAKLQILMESEGITFNDLRAALQKMQGIKIHVIGDTIVDSYTHCRMVGGMTKTPTISVQYEQQVDYSGGAAVVSKHMRGAGANVTLSTVLGNDPLRDFVLKDLEAAGVNAQVVIDKTRPTTNKNSIIAQNYHLLRVSKLDNRVISDKVVTQVVDSISSTHADGYVFSDFRHGMFNRNTIPIFVGAVPKSAFKSADSQVASRWGNILEFENFDLITPNEKEARFALGDQDSVVRPLALELYKRAGCKNLIMTLGERGLMAYRAPQAQAGAFFVLDSFADHVIDAVGAGDALLSYSSLALVATGNIVIASILGAIAGAIACEHDGNNPVSPEDVIAKLESVEKVVTFSCLDFS